MAGEMAVVQSGGCEDVSERFCSGRGEGGTKLCTVMRFGDVLVGESGIQDDVGVSDRARGSTA